ncbi:RluA family pseudouridine synthase [Candidatus Uhrbacteria bacterium]|nr:RluA family pseudouridine synthase [Candidatus Uhrbacteria bacterium]
MERFDFIIDASDAGKRLDHVLHAHFPTFSRSHIQRAIKEGHILMNAKNVAVHHFLKTGDTISGTLEERATLTCTPNAALTIPIITETQDYLIINKPSGIVVHQAEGHREPDTVANWAVAHAPALATVGDDVLRPGIVHRLDSDVSGCMVIAKTAPMFTHLKQAFQEGRVEKIYTALVYGVMPDRGGTIDFGIARSATKGGRMAARPIKTSDTKHLTPDSDDIKDAITEYTVIQQFQQYALLEVRPKTGRTHQIRVHLYALGYPIVGDPLYKPKVQRTTIVERIFLHARQLSFTDLVGQKQTFTSPLPAQLQEVLGKLDFRN